MQNEQLVIFRDESILAVRKPAGLLSEYDEKKPSMPAVLKADQGLESIYTVHRLDRTTQGLMVYALTAQAAKRLSELIRSGGMEKTYLAVIEGVPKAAAGELADLLYYDRSRNKSYVVRRERKGVKEARLRYEVVKTAEHEGQTLSLVRIRLLTGRTHQIRVQFASRKLPLVGDRRYGSRLPAQSIMLCSSKLRFPHPFTGEEMVFSYTPTNEYFGVFADETAG